MITQINDVLIKQCQVLLNRPLMLAISGGPDSLFLLEALHQLDYPLIIVHYDHQFRPESSSEAQKLASIAADLGVPFCLGQADVARYARENGLSLEAAGRRLRYGFLFEQANLQHAQAVVTGHTADDQVETILLHLLRGAGLAGLRGMLFRSLPNAWSQEIPLLRPLLGVWRWQINHFIKENHLEPFEDPSNQDARFTRNRLRHEILPILESLHPGFKQRLWQISLVFQEDFELLEQTISSAWQTCLLEKTNTWLAFRRPALLNLSPALQRHLYRQAAQTLQPDLEDLDSPALERACRFVLNPPRSYQVDWLGGLRLKIDGDCLWITSWQVSLPCESLEQFPQAAPGQPVRINIPGEIYLNNTWKLVAKLILAAETDLTQAAMNEDPYQVWIDSQTIEHGLQIRQRLPGDRIQPFGMGGHSSKVSDLMINLKIPARARPAWPVVVSGESIVWVPGVRLGEPFRLNPDSSSVVVLKLIRIK